MRVFELADELNVRSIDVLDACADVGLAGMDAGSELTEDQVKRVRFSFNQREVAALMASAASAERSSAPVLTPIADPTPPWSPPMPVQGQGPARAHPVLRPHSQGMHPLIKRSIWHFALGHVVPCVGLYFLVSSVILAGKGRRQIRWSSGRYSGDTAGLVIQILFWAELALTVLLLVVYIAAGGASSQQ